MGSSRSIVDNAKLRTFSGLLDHRLVDNIELSPYMFSQLFYYVLCKLIFDDCTALTFPFSPVFVWYCQDTSNYLSCCLAKKGGLLFSITLFHTNLSDFESIVL